MLINFKLLKFIIVITCFINPCVVFGNDIEKFASKLFNHYQYDDKINKNYLESSLAELKDLFKENYQDNKIIHFIINRYLIDGDNYTAFDQEIEADHMCVEVNFISVPNTLIDEISNVIEKYQIKIDDIFDMKYIKKHFEGKPLDLPIMAFKIQSGHNQNEIALIPKSSKKIRFFEKFFQLFS